MGVLAVVVIVTFLGDLTTEGAPTNNPESERAEDARLAAFPSDPATAVTDVVVIRSEGYAVDSPRFKAYVREFVSDSEITLSAVLERTSTTAARRSCRRIGTRR